MNLADKNVKGIQMFNSKERKHVALIIAILSGLIIISYLTTWKFLPDPIWSMIFAVYFFGGSVSAFVTFIAWLSLVIYSEKKRGHQEPAYRTLVLPVIIGVLERIIYTTLIGFDVSGAGIFIGTWLGIKVAGGWSTWSQDKTLYGKVLFFSALIVNAISIICGTVGGIILAEWDDLYEIFSQNPEGISKIVL